MRMLPPYLSASTASNAEKKLFAALKAVPAGEGWSALHSLELSSHRYKAVGEIDFLIAGPRGVFALEVKGGGISCRDGIWYYRDRFGREHRSSEGPFHQVRSALFSLRDRLQSIIPAEDIDQVVFGFGVVFPDCDFTVSGVEWDQRMVLDAATMRHGVDRYLRSLASYWQSKFPTKPDRVCARVISDIVQRVRPDFEMVRSIRAVVDELEHQQVELTRAQYQYLDAARDNRRVLVCGGAGTGKTMLAVETARREAASGRRTLLVCFNPMLARFIENQPDLSPGVHVKPVHQLFIDLAQRLELMPTGYSASMGLESPWFTQQLLPIILGPDCAIPESERFDTLIIDEAQDIFSLEYLLALGTLLKAGIERGRWRIFHDRFNQGAIYGQTEAVEVEELLVEHATVINLDTNCRNTSEIVAQTSLVTGADLGSTDRCGLPVTVELCEDDYQVAQKFAAHLKQRQGQGIPPSAFTIVSPRPWEQSAARLLPMSLLRGMTRLDADGHLTPPVDALTFSTITDFKGLENAHIALLDVDAIDEDARDLSALYVGMSRARAELWMALSPQAFSRYEQLFKARVTSIPGRPLHE